MWEVTRTVGLFVVAAVCEITGAYLVWQWQRDGKPAWLALIGVSALFVYSLIQTLQGFGFGRTFAAYGAVFILVALLWSWFVDHQVPDRWDWLGVVVCLIGAAIILGAPRR